MNNIDWKIFEHPTKEYRAKPFWALNGKLEKKNLKFQIERMKEMGFGGAFLHSRTGLQTEYMSEEWLDLIDYAVEEFKKQGMDAYLYDEDRWPSGTCGGLVTKIKEYRAKSMLYDEIDKSQAFTPPENMLGLFAVRLDERGRACDYRPIKRTEEASEEERVFVFYYVYMACESFYNGYTYADTMNRQATEYFIELTHEKYREKMGDKFGKEIVGIFTDEPHRGPFLNGFGRKDEKKELEIPYTYTLFDEFYKRKGYRIEERLPVLWFGKADDIFCKETYDLIEVEQELFIENFAKPYHEWCNKYKLKVTGHVLHEDNLAAQTTMCGSVMRYYEYMDYPGMDNLFELNYAYNVPALVNSVAKQLGKEFVLDELYAGTGWKMRFSDYKHTGDWQSALGVNLRCPHLSWYTMQGEAKRDYPASMLHQSAWYNDFSVVEDYFARMQYLLHCGEDCTDAAIINPVESTWGLTNQYTYVNLFDVTVPAYQRLEREYAELYKGLIMRGENVDYIDEGIFQKYGKISDGSLYCGKKKYKTVLLNGNLTLKESTLSLLNAFLKEGGRVLIVGRRPAYLNGEKYDFSNDLQGAEELPFDVEKVFERMTDGEVRTGDSRLIVQKRRVGKETLVFFLNTQKEETFTAEIRIRTPLSCDKLDLRTGSRTGFAYRRDGRDIVFEKTFVGDEELMLLLTDEPHAVPAEKELLPIPMPEFFDFKLKEPNVLVLDDAEYFFNGEPQGRGYVLNVDRAVRDKFGLDWRNVEMIQPWFKEKYFPAQDKKYGKVTLRFTFNAEFIPDDVWLMAEDLKNTAVTLNGTPVAGALKETPIDNAFSLLRLPSAAFVYGKNLLELCFDFYEKTNIEGVFLCGDFGVRTGEVDTLFALPNQLHAGDIAAQGLPYYGGRIELSADLENGEYKISTDDLNCALMKINGRTIAFAPYEGTAKVTCGKLNVELIFSRNNTFGCTDANGAHVKLIPQGLIQPLRISRIKI